MSDIHGGLRHARPRTIALTTLAALATLIAGCSAPTPTPPPPPVITNTPPTIVSVTTDAPRVDAGDMLTLTATVHDAETPVDQLEYNWSVAPLPGTFTGAGASVKWLAPSQQKTPDTYTFTLNLVEHFTSAGQAKQNAVSSTVQVHYNNSFVELSNLALDFLVNKFGDFSVSPQECVSNFSDSCRGKADELSDITNNRKFFHILSASYSVATIEFNANKTFANISGPCVFEDIVQSTGVRERVTGNCLLTGVYENFKWLLCDSTFESTAPTVPFELLRYRAPGVR